MHSFKLKYKCWNKKYNFINNKQKDNIKRKNWSLYKNKSNIEERLKNIKIWSLNLRI